MLFDPGSWKSVRYTGGWLESWPSETGEVLQWFSYCRKKCFGDEIFMRQERAYNFKRKGLVSPWPSVKSLIVLCVVLGLRNLCTWPGSLVKAWAASRMGSRPNWGVLLEVQLSVGRGFMMAMTPVWGTFHLFSHGNEVIDRSLGNWFTEGKWCFPASCTSQKPSC